MAELKDKLFPRGPEVALQWDLGRSNRPEERQGGGHAHSPLEKRPAFVQVQVNLATRTRGLW